ncbi:hypothetical protein JCM33374_g6540 [Metschnikowia sp. JCM 33374]|nr:hypothetical protein JCM33374_g6540 [Metschnikowia sp. JCM 33374]
MSSTYLQSILPIPEQQTQQNEPITESITPFKDLSEQELGVLSSKFELFSENLRPFREKLKPIEKFLIEFDAEINHLADSLRSLQTQSNDLSLGLDNHRAVVEKLNPVILDLVVPPSVSHSVLRDPITEKWIENINFITEKQQLIHKVMVGTTSLPYKDTHVFTELQESIRLLEAKAIERIRNHLIEQIRLLRRAKNSSSQVIQRNLLQVKEAFAFLKTRHPQLANQLQLAYVYTMKWYYTTRFAKYLHSLQKLKLKHIDQSYVLGSSWGPARAEYFSSVPRRMNILHEENEAQRAIPSQIAETSPFAYWLEFAFNQFSNALLDNVIVEYLFAIDFFYQGSEKFDSLTVLDPKLNATDNNKDWSHLMFEEVFKMGHSYANWLVSASHQTLGSRIASGSGVAAAYGSNSAAHGSTCDGYAVLLMIRLIQKQNSTLHNQFHVPVMEDYHNALLLSLWPHFTRIIDINCDALKKNILGKSSYLHTSSGVNHAPIHTTQQFAQFLSGLFKLAFTDEDDNNTDKQLFSREPISMSITRLRNDFEGALTKASAYVFGNSKSKAAHKEMFLFNNYFLLVTILSNEFESTTNVFIQDQIKHFQLLCDAYKPK